MKANWTVDYHLREFWNFHLLRGQIFILSLYPLLSTHSAVALTWTSFVTVLRTLYFQNIPSMLSADCKLHFIQCTYMLY